VHASTLDKVADLIWRPGVFICFSMDVTMPTLGQKSALNLKARNIFPLFSTKRLLCGNWAAWGSLYFLNKRFDFGELIPFVLNHSPHQSGLADPVVSSKHKGTVFIATPTYCVIGFCLF
jgi:hypothetical protein